MLTSAIQTSKANLDFRNDHFQKKKKQQNWTICEKHIKTSVLYSSMDLQTWIYCTKVSIHVKIYNGIHVNNLLDWICWTEGIVEVALLLRDKGNCDANAKGRGIWKCAARDKGKRIR